MRALVHHLRSQAVAYLALFIALGGTGYAAIALPHNSVGTAQLRNGAVTPAKLAGREIGGTIWAWAEVDLHSKLIAGRGLKLVRAQDSQYGFYFTHGKPAKSCVADASVVYTPISGVPTMPGFAIADLEFAPPPAAVGVETLSPAGTRENLPFVVQVVC